MKLKICFKCKVEKDLSEFYKHKGNLDGHLNKCKECTKKDTKERTDALKKDESWVLKERERSREKYYRLSYKNKYKRKSNLSNFNYKNKYPEKYLAKLACNKLIRLNENTHLHHWSYNKEHYKDVIELYYSDHSLLHRHMIYDNERMMYRNLDGILLDTKQSHIDLLNKIKQDF